MIYNRIQVAFGSLRKATAPAISYQYDVVQKLIIKGLELPEYYQVDFCNDGDASTITMVGTADGVDIPDQFLQTGRNVKAYLVVTGVDNGAAETRYEITIPVNKRPARTDIEPTPEEQRTIDSLIAAMNDAVDDAEASATAAEGFADNASVSADRAEQAAQSIDGKVERAEAAAQAAGVSATRAEDAAEDAEVYRDEAEQSAGSASSSAEDARNSKETAIEKADEAEQSAAQAAASAASIEGDVQEAEQAAQQAEASATAASQSATAAQGSATAASGSATVATNKAAEASESATTATEKATEAANSATAAQTAQTGAEAAQAAAEAVLESIPEDYSELSDDVGELKNAINDVSQFVYDNERIPTTTDGMYTLRAYVVYVATGQYTASSTGKFCATYRMVYNAPLLLKLDLAEYEWNVWSYTRNDTPTHSNTNKRWFNGTSSIYVDKLETDNKYAIGFKRVDGGTFTTDLDDPTSDYYKIKHALKVYVANKKADAASTEDAISNLDLAIQNIKDGLTSELFDATDVNLQSLFIRTSDNVLASVTPARLVVLPIKQNTTYLLSVGGESTKRIGTTIANPAANVAVSNIVEHVGPLSLLNYHNTTGNYLCIQLFLNSDTDQVASNYYDSISVSTAQTNPPTSCFFATENLKGLPILENITDVSVDGSTWSNPTAYHAMMDALCNSSDGFVTKTLMGQDAHSNDLYYYKTNPTALYYGANRGSVTPAYPFAGGFAIKPYRVILTSNLHGREQDGDYVIYNLLNKMLQPDSDLLKWFRNNVELICMPRCCPSNGNGYENIDGENINRSFPTAADASATCPEAALIKAVIDNYANGTDLMLDLHTFQAGTTGAKNYLVSWIFTDDNKLGSRGARTTADVLGKYREAYPSESLLQRGNISAVNLETTSSYYANHVYGIPAGTVEVQETIDGLNPSGSDVHTGAVAVYYDIVTQLIAGMAQS